MGRRHDPRTVKKKKAWKKLQNITWNRGSGTALYYIVCMWLLALMIVLFTEYYHSLGKVGSAQMTSDVLIDGTTYVANNGASIDKKTAKQVYSDLKTMNSGKQSGSFMKDVRLPSSPEIVSVEEKNSKNGKKTSYSIKKAGKNGNGTAVKAVTKATTLSAGEKISSNAMNSADYTSLSWASGSEGMRIVLEAWKHTYEFTQHHGGAQTGYLWGGGHGISNDPTTASGRSWATASDCSGFVSGVFRTCGYVNINSNHYTGSLEDCGTLIGAGGSLVSILDHAQPGDIILYWRHGYAKYLSQHVTIFAGKKDGHYYCVECRGGSKDLTPQYGSRKGAHIDECEQGGGYYYMVRRLIRSNATTKATKAVHIGGLSERGTRAAQMLADAGFSKAGIAGILANWSYESGAGRSASGWDINPNAINGLSQSMANSRAGTVKNLDLVSFALASGVPGSSSVWNGGDGGYGIAQWTTVTEGAGFLSDRKAKLWQWAHSMNSDVSSLDAQVSFSLHEMQTTHPGTYRQCLNATDPRAAALVMFKDFEAGGSSALINNGSMGARLSYASSIYSSLG